MTLFEEGDTGRHEDLRHQADLSLAKLAEPGLLAYPLACIVLSLVASHPNRHPLLFYPMLSLVLGITLWRRAVIRGFDTRYARDPKSWRRAFMMGIFALVALWSALSLWVAIEDGFADTSYLALFITATASNAALAVYVSHLWLARSFFIALFGPQILSLAWAEVPVALAALAILLSFAAYLWVETGVLNARYWQSLLNAEAAQARTRELESVREDLETAREDLVRLVEKRTSDYQRIFENAHDAILVIEPKSESVLAANQRAAEVYGLPLDELVGMSIREVSKDLERGREHFERTLSSGTFYNFETVQYRADGTEMILEINASVVEYGGGRAVLSINRDVTARRQAEAELERHRLELESLVAARTAELERVVRRLEAQNEELERRKAEVDARSAETERVIYTVSHDLRSPLVTIRGFLGYLRRDLVDGNAERTELDIEQIAQAADTMGELLNELLEFSRVTRERRTIEEVSLEELAQEAVSRVSGRIAERGVQVEVGPGLPVLFGDRQRLVRVFQNLIDNAVKYMGDEPSPRVEVGVREEDGETVIYVADNGVGIAPEDLGRVFGLFERLGRGDEGTGIGLSLVERVIEGHGGRVWAESEGEGKGSTFCFVLPRLEKVMAEDGGE